MIWVLGGVVYLAAAVAVGKYLKYMGAEYETAPTEGEES